MPDTFNALVSAVGMKMNIGKSRRGRLERIGQLACIAIYLRQPTFRGFRRWTDCPLTGCRMRSRRLIRARGAQALGRGGRGQSRGQLRRGLPNSAQAPSNSSGGRARSARRSARPTIPSPLGSRPQDSGGRSSQFRVAALEARVSLVRGDARRSSRFSSSGYGRSCEIAPIAL